MKVTADTSDCKIELGNNGITFDIADEAGKHIGHLRIGQATVEWRRGKTQAGNGKKIKLRDLIDLLNQA
jgi:hypothetical protein